MNGTVAVGIDRRGDSFYAVKMTTTGGRTEVAGFYEYSPNDPQGITFSPGDSVAISVPDDQVIVKPLNLDADGQIDVHACGCFELAQSMLEPETAFRFDVLDTDSSHWQLGLVYRRQRLDQQRSEYCGDRATEVTFLVRAAALGRGYLAFARQAPGELIALADIAGALVSICFIQDRQLVGLAHSVLDEAAFASDETLEKMAMELRTVVNLGLASLAGRGITLPLTTLLLSGKQIDQRVSDAFTRYFPSGINAPEVNLSFLSRDARIETTPPEHFLVAMGLTVN
jgi:hypothetical protein